MTMPAHLDHPPARRRVVLDGRRLGDVLRKIFKVQMDAKSVIGTAGFALLAAGSTGCAVHYYEKSTGTEHLWGFGHLKMKFAPPSEGVQAVVRGTETLGFNLAAGQEDYQVGLGWDYRRRIVIGSNAAVR